MIYLIVSLLFLIVLGGIKMAQNQQDLQSAISALNQLVASRSDAQAAAIKRLEDKVAAASPDLTAEVSAVVALAVIEQSDLDKANAAGI